MKISIEQLKKAFQYASSKKGEATKVPFSPEELRLLKEMLKRMPDSSVRHLDYSRIREECEKVSSEDVADKLLVRKLVDKLFEKIKEGED
ncbi:MAG: hypothetical protein HWN69_05885 [Desulfobacterales bacterium]|nr:hypothetical protein [Desulfobacterales bacterium]